MGSQGTVSDNILLDEERARISPFVVLFIRCFAILCLAHGLVISTIPALRPLLWMHGVNFVVLLAAHFVLRGGRPRLAAHLLLAFLWPLFIYIVYIAGGVERPSFAWSILLLLFAGFALGARVCIAYTVATFAAGLAMAYLRLTGRLVPLPFYANPLVAVSGQFAGLVGCAIFIITAVRLLKKHVEQERAQRSRLADQNRVLAAEVSARQLAETSLLHANDRLRSFVSNASAILFAFDRNGIFTISDGKGLADLGLKPGEVVGKSVFDVYAGQPHLIAAVRRALTGEEFTVTLTFGDVIYDTWYSPLRDPVTNELSGAMAIALDVTRRQRAEESLEKRLLALTRPLGDTSNIRFEDLFNISEIQQVQDAFAAATGVASIITDIDGTPITMPSGFCRLCSDIIRCTEKGRTNCMKSDAMLGRFNPEGPILQPCLSGGLWDGGTSIHVADRHIANWLVGQVRDDSIDVDQIMQYAREIGADEAEFRAALAEVPRMPRQQFAKVCEALYLVANQLSRLALQNVQQARYIKEQAAVEEALRSAKQAAESASAVKDQFMAMVSHELRTPLTPVLLSVSQLASSSSIPETLRNDLAEVQRHIEIEARLIDDLLDLSRINSGKLSIHVEPCDLHSIISATIQVCRATVDTKRISLTCDLKAMDHYVMGDPGRLQQVFWNLIKNSTKFTSHDGHIVIRTRNEVSQDGQSIIVEVADDGVGLDPSSNEIIFGIFQQVGPVSRNLGGLGLGLAICRAITNAHHGTIMAHSPGLGRGSTFTLALLTTTIVPAERARPLPADAGLSESGHLRILLVEDHEATAALLARLLQKMGHQVLVAHRVDDAIKLAKNNPLDLLISDIGLPDGTGVDLLIALRKTTQVPAIALSGFGMDQDIARSLAAGFHEHLVKPIDVARLRQAIARVAAPKGAK